MSYMRLYVRGVSIDKYMLGEVGTEGEGHGAVMPINSSERRTRSVLQLM